MWEKLSKTEQLRLVGTYIGSIGLVALIAFGWGRSVGQSETEPLQGEKPLPVMGEPRQVLDLGKQQNVKMPSAKDSTKMIEETGNIEPEPDTGEIFVHVTGRVKKPGVYKLTPGQRVEDAVSLAGGPQPDADMDQINLAAKVTDSEKIIVPRKGAMMPATMSPSGTVILPPSSGTSRDPTQSNPKTLAVVNVNRASAEELERLPGVGPVLAERILELRRQRGRFSSVEELLEVRGIGPKKLEDMRPYVRLN
jgi:competence protein ComEA